MQVQNLSGVTAIAGGAGHSLALKNDGTVRAWGDNQYYQLGDGSVTNRRVPVQVQSLSGVNAIACGENYCRALKTDGTVRAWGRSHSGQLGDNTTTNRAYPVQVQNLTGINAIACGAGHSLAMKADGTVWAGGRNQSGQLGDNTTAARHTPIQTLGAAGTGYLNLRIAVTGITLDRPEVFLVLGASAALTATVLPANATNKSVNYTSSDSTVATVNASGQITAAAVGDATITATTVDGNYTATCDVEVSNPESIQYIYDLSNRLITINMEDQTITYGYDANGNITSITVTELD